MSERDPDEFVPPKPVWVRIPPRGRQREAGVAMGLLHRWRRSQEWDGKGWEAWVSTDPEPDAPRRWVPAASVRERQDGDLELLR